MNENDKPELRRRLAATFELYRKDLTGTALGMWFEALRFYDLEVVSQALSAHVRNPDNGQFAPVPADVVKLIEGGSADVALIAWAKVDRAVRTVGTWKSVVFDDHVIHHVIDNLGGWIDLGKKSVEEWPFVRNQFVTLYRGARLRARQWPSRLVGIAEAHNSLSGQPTPLPVLLGDQDRARLVLQRGLGFDQVQGPVTVQQLLPSPALEGAPR